MIVVNSIRSLFHSRSCDWYLFLRCPLLPDTGFLNRDGLSLDAHQQDGSSIMGTK
jgi:hypothetical protein